MYIKYVFNIYSGRDLSIALPFEDYPVPEKYGYRLWTNKVYPCYDINNEYMGYMDNEQFYDMKIGDDGINNMIKLLYRIVHSIYTIFRLTIDNGIVKVKLIWRN